MTDEIKTHFENATIIHLEYYNTLVMEDGSDPHFTLGYEYVLHESPDSEDGPVFLFNDLGDRHHFDEPGYRDLMGFSIDDYFRVNNERHSR